MEWYHLAAKDFGSHLEGASFYWTGNPIPGLGYLADTPAGATASWDREKPGISPLWGFHGVGYKEVGVRLWRDY
jgi:hypothetical protein